jgi:hypothetical protein
MRTFVYTYGQLTERHVSSAALGGMNTDAVYSISNAKRGDESEYHSRSAIRVVTTSAICSAKAIYRRDCVSGHGECLLARSAPCVS